MEKMGGFVIYVEILTMKVRNLFTIIFYIVRTRCNRCGHAQMIYKSSSIQSGNISLSNNFKQFSSGLSPMVFPNSHFNLGNNILMGNTFNQTEDKSKNPKPFVEREGDWICVKCKNLNFAFRIQCNRCHLTKSENNKLLEQIIS